MNCETTIQHVIRLFDINSPCVSDLSMLIPAFWELSQTEACGNEYIQYLITKREAILLLMGCEAYSIDTYDSHRNMVSNTVADSRSDFRSQGQSTGNSTRFAKGNGNTRFDELSNGITRGNSTRTQRGDHKGDGTSFYRDDGKGYGFNNSQSTNTINVIENSQSFRTSSARSAEKGRHSDCNYEASRSQTDGSSLYLPIGGPFFSVGGSFTGSGSEWNKYLQNKTVSKELGARVSEVGSVHNVTDFRSSQGTHTWESYFLANIAWQEHDFEITTDKDRSDDIRHTESHAQGSGDGISEERSESHNASQGTLKIDSRSDSTRTVRKTDTISAITLMNSQRFRNLRKLYDQVNEQIIHQKKKLRNISSPRVATMSFSCTSCCIPPYYKELLDCGRAVCHI